MTYIITKTENNIYYQDYENKKSFDLINKTEEEFKDAYDKNEVYLLAASSAPEDVTEQRVKDIEASFPGMPVMCDNLTLSLSCHIGYGGLGIACSCKPRVI